MNTTDNTYGDAPAPKTEVTKDDAKVMKDAYIKGSTIDDLALTYDYDTKLVEAAVVAPVTDEPVAPTQAETEEVTPTKKGK